jgi:hypothetical protein
MFINTQVMMKQFSETTCPAHYEAPRLEVMQVEVEQGFSATGDLRSYSDETNDSDEGYW